MEGCIDDKDEEMESERKKLLGLKRLLKKFLEKKLRIEESFATEEIQSLKKNKDLMKLQASLEQKVDKLEVDIKSTQQAIENKLEEMKWLMEGRDEQQEELLQKQSAYWKKYHETVAELEREVKREYVEYQNERDMKMLMETVRKKLSKDQQGQLAVKIFKKKKKWAAKREEDLNKAKEKLTDEVNSATEDIENLKRKVDLLKAKYESLLEVYAMSKKAKDAVGVTWSY